MSSTRSGLGFDLHPLVDGRPLVLGGIAVPHERGLGGHSDADVLTHAVCEALLGALALGDLGHMFPDIDPRWRGVSSLVLLEGVMAAIGKKGARLVNVDATVICQARGSHAPTRNGRAARGDHGESGRTA
jgi:2-C-methyl-D-erythritol 2,4-cyclodiphosphate synthase